MLKHAQMLEAMLRFGKVEYAYQCVVTVPGDLPGIELKVVGTGDTQEKATEDAYNRGLKVHAWVKPKT